MSIATTFAALGHGTRLELVSRLSDGKQRSITKLSGGLNLTRQGVTKHLQVLRRAGVVTLDRVGRESRYSINPEAVAQARDYLIHASQQWDEAIERLRESVEG